MALSLLTVEQCHNNTLSDLNQTRQKSKYFGLAGFSRIYSMKKDRSFRLLFGSKQEGRGSLFSIFRVLKGRKIRIKLIKDVFFGLSDGSEHLV